MLSISIFVRLGQANSFIDESHHQTRANSALFPYQGEMVASGRANFRTNRLEGFVHLTGRYDFPCFFFFFFFFFERFKGSHLEPHKTPNLLPYSSPSSLSTISPSASDPERWERHLLETGAPARTHDPGASVKRFRLVLPENFGDHIYNASWPCVRSFHSRTACPLPVYLA